jgi:hypothetical protein
MKSEEWKEKLIKGSSGEDAWAILKDLEFAEQNRDRFWNHLDRIVYALNIAWWDGDFPIDEVFEKIKNEIVNKP